MKRGWFWGTILIWVGSTVLIGICLGLGWLRPPGQEIIFTTYGLRGRHAISVIRLMDTVRGLSIPLTDERYQAASPLWSPDGQTLAFIYEIDGNSGLYGTAIEMGTQRPLSAGLNVLDALHWQLDGQQIVIAVRQGISSPNLSLFDPATGESHLLEFSGSSAHQLSWSPDGQWVILARYHDDAVFLNMINLSCKQCPLIEQPLFSAGYIKWPPAWSWDGHRIVFTLNNAGNTELYRVAIDCKNWESNCIGQPVQLTDNPAHDFAPAWSPDNRTIAFLSDRDGQPAIYVMDVDSGVTRRLSQENFKSESLSWSPDGSQILLASAQGNHSDIFLVDAETGQVRRLTGKNVENTVPVWRP